jgi:hypothetical protein
MFRFHGSAGAGYWYHLSSAFVLLMNILIEILPELERNIYPNSLAFEARMFYYRTFVSSEDNIFWSLPSRDCD